jgi:hypothetical protein
MASKKCNRVQINFRVAFDQKQDFMDNAKILDKSASQLFWTAYIFWKKNKKEVKK